MPDGADGFPMWQVWIWQHRDDEAKKYNLISRYEPTAGDHRLLKALGIRWDLDPPPDPNQDGA